MSKWDYILAPVFLAGACYFIWDAIKDMRRGENRPKVTDDLIVMAFERDIMQRSDEELAQMDWESEDDEEMDDPSWLNDEDFYDDNGKYWLADDDDD